VRNQRTAWACTLRKPDVAICQSVASCARVAPACPWVSQISTSKSACIACRWTLWHRVGRIAATELKWLVVPCTCKVFYICHRHNTAACRCKTASIACTCRPIDTQPETVNTRRYIPMTIRVGITKIFSLCAPDRLSGSAESIPRGTLAVARVVRFTADPGARATKPIFRRVSAGHCSCISWQRIRIWVGVGHINTMSRGISIVVYHPHVTIAASSCACDGALSCGAIIANVVALRISAARVAQGARRFARV
jgi:hypothetical protein